MAKRSAVQFGRCERVQQQPLDLFALQPFNRPSTSLVYLNVCRQSAVVVCRLQSPSLLFALHFPAQGSNKDAESTPQSAALTLTSTRPSHPRRYTTQSRQVRASNNPPRLGQRLPNLVLRRVHCEKRSTRTLEALANKHTQCRNHTGMFCSTTSHPHRHAHTPFQYLLRGLLHEPRTRPSSTHRPSSSRSYP
jgi:hypothetical protein